MKTLTSATHIGKVRTQNLTQLQRVCELLNWSHEKYCNHQFSQYEDFINRACRDLPKAENLLRYSSIFRGFYNQEWSLRTQSDFLPHAIEMTKHICEVDRCGDLIYVEGVPNGHYTLVAEYLTLHEARGLFYDEVFAVKYCNIIDLILKKRGYV